MRKEALPNKTTTVLGLPECWILEDNGQLTYLSNSIRNKGLPKLEKEYEELLKKMNIPYRLLKLKNGTEICEYWNRECFQEMELTLPFYEKIEGVYLYTHRFHTSKVQSPLTIQKAKELEEKVEQKKNEFRKELEEQRLFNEVRKLVSGKQAVGADISGMSIAIAEKISDDKIKVLPVRYANGDYSYYFAIFNLAEIEKKKGTEIRMEVPKGNAGLFIGSGKWQVREWCKTKWAKKLHITRIWVE